MHSTRSGRFSLAEEYDKTVAYMMRPGSNSSHRVIGYERGQYAQVVPDELQAWHAEELNERYLGVELSQPRPGDPYSEWQYKALGYLLREWASAHGFALNRQNVLGHEETEQGRRNGKSDPGPGFDWSRIGL